MHGLQPGPPAREPLLPAEVTLPGKQMLEKGTSASRTLITQAWSQGARAGPEAGSSGPAGGAGSGAQPGTC